MQWRTVLLTVTFLTALVLPSVAQVQVGDNLSMHLLGTLSTGYNADYSNLSSSDHSVGVGGNAELNGYYYNPNFLSFGIDPFYSQSRANSNYQSVTNASGVTSSVALFGGSPFPGSIAYSKTFNSEGQLSVPGLANVTTHGDNGALSINWGLNLDDLPHVSFGYSRGTNAYSVFGANADGTSSYNTFSASTSYRIDGFNMNGAFVHTGTQAENPQLFSTEGAQASNSSGNSFSVGLGHKLPFNGSFSASASRASDSATSDGVSDYTGTINSLNAGVSFSPIRNLSLGENTYYTDNLTGTLLQGLISSGVAVQPAGNQSSHALDLSAYTNYQIPTLHVTFSGNVDHRQQTLEGDTLGSTSTTGTTTYSNNLLGGYLTAVGGVTETSENAATNQNALGLITSLSYTHNIEQWTISVAGNYSRNQQTVLIETSASSYGYSGSVGRNFAHGRHWGASAAGSKSVAGDSTGSRSLSQSYSTLASTRRYSLSGSYTKASGNSILTNAGLTTVPIVPPGLLPTSITNFGGRSYSAGFGASPVNGLTLSASYANSWNNTITNSVASKNTTEMLYFQAMHRYRKLFFNAGYSRLLQGFTASGTPASSVSSYYVGVSRWFNVF
jgi:hypothetical protein